MSRRFLFMCVGMLLLCSYSDQYTPLLPGGVRSKPRQSSRANGGRCPGGRGTNDSGGDTKKGHSRRPWAGTTRRNTILGGSEAMAAVWLQRKGEESVECEQALDEIRDQQGGSEVLGPAR